MVQKESIAEIIGSFGVGRQLNDLSSDSGPAETYDFTLRGSNRGESIGWRKWAGRKKVLTMRWTVREALTEKKMFSFGHCPKGGGGDPCPNFFTLFHQLHLWSIK